MKYTLATAAGSIALLASGAALAIDRGDPSAGERIAEDQCMACHAVDESLGNPEWPKIAGQYGNYLLHSLREYKDGNRENAVMQGQVEDLSLQDLRDVASYYSRLDGDLYVPRR